MCIYFRKKVQKLQKVWYYIYNMEEKSFTVSPMSQSISLKPGETYSGSIKVANPSDAKSAFSYEVELTPYSVIGEDYSADLMTKGAYSKILDWVTIENPKGTLEPNDIDEIKYTIKVPSDAAGGGQYFTLAVSQDVEAVQSESAQIQNILQIASIVYASVDGEIIHDGTILQNNIPNFALSTPVTIGALLQNNGNVHSIAGFDIQVKDAFTGNVIFPKEEEPASVFSEVVMPESTYYATREISELPSVGVVHISQTVNFEGQTSTNEQTIFICPLWLLLTASFCFFALIFFIVYRIIHRKKQKKSAE